MLCMHLKRAEEVKTGFGWLLTYPPPSLLNPLTSRLPFRARTECPFLTTSYSHPGILSQGHRI